MTGELKKLKSFSLSYFGSTNIADESLSNAIQFAPENHSIQTLKLEGISLFPFSSACLIGKCKNLESLRLLSSSPLDHQYHFSAIQSHNTKLKAIGIRTDRTQEINATLLPSVREAAIDIFSLEFLKANPQIVHLNTLIGSFLEADNLNQLYKLPLRKISVSLPDYNDFEDAKILINYILNLTRNFGPMKTKKCFHLRAIHKDKHVFKVFTIPDLNTNWELNETLNEITEMLSE